MLKITEDTRALYFKLQIITSVLVVAAHWIIVLLNIWKPPEALPTKALLYLGVPVVLISLYLTSYKKIFSQRIGDVIQSCVLILLISAFSFYYGNGIGGDFIFLFLLLIVFSTLLLDPFIPLFIGSLTGSIIIGEFLLTTDFTEISYVSITRFSLALMALLMVGWVSSNLVKKTLIEKKTSQKLKKAYRELKKLDVAKSEFIAMASHQLRTPLTAVKGLTSMILEGTYNHIKGKLKKPIKSISNSTERLIEIINDLLNISKIELGKLEMEKKEVQIEKLIEGVFQEMKSFAKKRNLNFIWQKPEIPLPKIKVDRIRMRQAILSLVDNAIRYTEEGEVKIKCKVSNGKCQISVSDTGEGLTEEEKEKIFEPFTRGAAGLSRWIQGAGLALYLAKKYVGLHDGKIWAESPGKGKGSTFYIEIPIE